MRDIARDTGVSKFLIRQTVHEDSQYFSYEMRKGQQDCTLPHKQESHRMA